MSLGTPASLGPLEPGEHLECRACGYVTRECFEDDYACPACDEVGKFLKRKPAGVSSRWPAGVVGQGYAQVPELLTRHAAALGLKAIDVGLMAAFLNYEHRASGRINVGFPKLAGEVGADEKTVRRRVDTWVSLGLWEKRQQWDKHGRRSTCSLTCEGMTEALSRVAENVAAEREPTDGVGQLLAARRIAAEFARDMVRAPRPDRPVTTPGPSGHHARAEPKGSEPEVLNHPQEGADQDRPFFDEDLLIRRLIEEFDAEEIEVG